MVLHILEFISVRFYYMSTLCNCPKYAFIFAFDVPVITMAHKSLCIHLASFNYIRWLWVTVKCHCDMLVMLLWPALLRLKSVQNVYTNLIIYGDLCSNLYISTFCNTVKKDKYMRRVWNPRDEERTSLQEKYVLDGFKVSGREESLVTLEIFVMWKIDNIYSVHL